MQRRAAQAATLTTLLEMQRVADPHTKATKLLTEFGNLRRVLNAKPVRLKRHVDDRTCRAICFYRSALLEALRPEPMRDLITSSKCLLPYLTFALADATLEEFHVFYLDYNCALIREEALAHGTIDRCEVYIRRIIERALEVGAAGLIVVHNHPSGRAEPSREDFALTQKLARTADALNIRLHEHLIVSSTGSYSWRAHGLL